MRRGRGLQNNATRVRLKFTLVHTRRTAIRCSGFHPAVYLYGGVRGPHESAIAVKVRRGRSGNHAVCCNRYLYAISGNPDLAYQYPRISDVAHHSKLHILQRRGAERQRINPVERVLNRPCFIDVCTHSTGIAAVSSSPETGLRTPTV